MTLARSEVAALGTNAPPPSTVTFPLTGCHGGVSWACGVKDKGGHEHESAAQNEPRKENDQIKPPGGINKRKLDFCAFEHAWDGVVLRKAVPSRRHSSLAPWRGGGDRGGGRAWEPRLGRGAALPPGDATRVGFPEKKHTPDTSAGLAGCRGEDHLSGGGGEALTSVGWVDWRRGGGGAA